MIQGNINIVLIILQPILYLVIGVVIVISCNISSQVVEFKIK